MLYVDWILETDELIEFICPSLLTGIIGTKKTMIIVFSNKEDGKKRHKQSMSHPYSLDERREPLYGIKKKPNNICLFNNQRQI